jgi:hypothetical protein
MVLGPQTSEGGGEASTSGAREMADHPPKLKLSRPRVLDKDKASRDHLTPRHEFNR